MYESYELIVVGYDVNGIMVDVRKVELDASQSSFTKTIQELNLSNDTAFINVFYGKTQRQLSLFAKVYQLTSNRCYFKLNSN